jgi:hypothetical protein
MRHAETEEEAAARDRVQRQCALGHLHRMHVLDRQHRGSHLKRVHLAHRHGQRCQQVAVVGHLCHPHPSEALVARFRQRVDQGIDR